MECRLVNTTSGMAEMHNLRDGITTIGRETDNNIQVLKANVSRHHAKITNLSSVCEVEDLKSRNGTCVNGDRITVMALRAGDEIRFGDEVFRFETVGSVGADELMGQHRDYSTRANLDTVSVQVRAPETKKLKGVVSTLPPLRPKK